MRLRRHRTESATAADTASADKATPPPAPPHADEPIAPSNPRPGAALLDVTSDDDHIELGSDFVARAAARTARRRVAEASPAPAATSTAATETPTTGAEPTAAPTPRSPTSAPAPAPAPPMPPAAAAVIEVDTGAVRVVEAPTPTPAASPAVPVRKDGPATTVDNPGVDSPETDHPATDHPDTDHPDVDFWALHAESQAIADLLDVPPTPVVAVVGPLEVAMTVARRCRSRHWIDGESIFIHTRRTDLVDEPSWEILDDETLGQRLDDGGRPSAMFVIDIPDELTPDITGIVRRLRADGPTLVHYVLDAEPSDDELATWHSRIGRPAVLDLFGPVDPARVLALLDRGEPVASIAGVPVTAELIQALRIDVLGRS